ncbi:bcl-2-like protein 10 [Ursus americanus]|uniref:bcl-2-like protein 10 n=1 Tax=Ursus americanus TaxID=9643 RepID=UPI001E679317|nr:bcl-2-like protein 10 [Ursus americanus]
MADALRERTARLLTDYLEYCAREPGTPARAPSTPEAAVLRSVAAQVQQRHEHFLSDYRGYGGNRVELVAQVEREILAHPQPLSWGRVVALLTFAGTLLERSPTGTYSNLGPDQELELGEREAGVRQDCRHLVDFLCNRLTGQHRAWLEAHDGWVSARVAGSGAGQPGTRPRGQHRERPRGFKPEKPAPRGVGESAQAPSGGIDSRLEGQAVALQLLNPFADKASPPLFGWLLSLLHTHAAVVLEKTAGPGSSVLLHSSDLNLLLEKIIVSSEIINAFLPA